MDNSSMTVGLAERPVPDVGAPLSAAASEAPAASMENLLCEVLAQVMKVEAVSPESKFFEDLGADSMVMARFCAKVRKQPGLPSISMKQVYATPTIRGLAAALTEAAQSTASATGAGSSALPAEAGGKAAQIPAREAMVPISTWRYVLCGVLQLATGIAYFLAAAEGVILGYGWAIAPTGWIDMYERAFVVTTGLLAAAILIPILAKWLLIGRWTPRRIRIWSLDYYRFWLVRTLVQTNPLVAAPSPIYALYLRALGARVGRDVLILSRRGGICADLLSIGDNTIIRKEASFLCYRAHAGWIECGPVRLGRNVVVGERTVLDIETAMGDGSQIGHASSLHEGQAIPAGEHRHGTPARQTSPVDYADVAPARCGPFRKLAYCLAVTVPSIFILPATFTVIAHVVLWLAERHYFDAPSITTYAHADLYIHSVAGSLALFLGALILSLATVTTVPRFFNRFLTPDKVYPLYGIHYFLQGLVAGMTNVRFFNYLFGDSSYIVHYLQAIGYDLGKVVQTGSNFGMDLKHDNPFLVSVGSGTVIADGLSFVSAAYSPTSFRISRVRIGASNFVGNHIAYPAEGRTGDNCLLGTKVMVPLSGEIREGVGLLGSPTFEIPRTVLRDDRLANRVPASEVPGRLRRKNRHNVATMGLFLLVNWFSSFLSVFVVFIAIDAFPDIGSLAVALIPALLIPARLLFVALVERASTGFKPLEPQSCSIYEPYFWFHERHWKMMARSSATSPFNGTPLKGACWRLLGMRVGKRLFDDGCGVTEHSMIRIGDDCTLNSGSIIQPHSQEDGSFKSDRIAIGANCTLGVGSWVHYGAVMGASSEIGPNSFLMKGEDVPAGEVWGENPAREIPLGAAVAVTAQLTQSLGAIVAEPTPITEGQAA